MSAPRIRLFVADALAPAVVLDLAPRAAHYLQRVMRRRTGDAVLVFNGRDGEWRARLAVERRAVTATIEERMRPPAAPSGPLLAMALVKRAALETVVEKACELGARAIQPLATEHGVVDRLNRERLGAIAIEAAEQSERLTVPDILEPRGLADWLAARAGVPPLYAALERAAAVPLTAVDAPGDLLVGPEGGFSPAERAALLAHPGVVPVGLGSQVLRAETAAIVGLGVLALRMPG